MDASDLRALAKEREARQRPAAAAAATTSPPLPDSWRAKPAPSSRGAMPSLSGAHRSILLARMFGVGLHLLSPLFWMLGFGRLALLLLLGGVGLARGGGALVHGAVPPMLRETERPPSKEEMDAAAGAGLYCVAGVRNFGPNLASEWAMALESLAFVCTYGKKNCLTNEMYRGELSLGKIAGLVWGKLREGVVRC